MDTIFMNSQNSKTSKPHVLILGKKAFLYEILVFIIHGKI